MPDFGYSKDALRAIIGLSGEFVGTTDTQVQTNKTVVLEDNTIKQTTPALGSILVDNGTKVVARARPAANLPLHGKADGTDIEYSKLEVAGGGTGAVTLSAGVVIAAGTSAFTTKSNPAGAFLDDSSVQNVTGAKTFIDTTLKFRNPANTFTLTQVNPAITASYNTELESPYSYVIYKTGTTIKRMNMVTRAIESSGTVADVQIQAAIDALGNDSGKRILIKSGVYSLTAGLNMTAINGNCQIQGEHGSATRLFPTGDYPALDINNKVNVMLKDLYFAHNQVGYTSNLLYLRNGAKSCSVQNCNFYDFGTLVGSAIGLDSTSAALTQNTFINLKSNGFASVINASVPNTSFFINANEFLGCRFSDMIRILTLTTAASTAFNNNNFIGCQSQARTSGAATECGFDYSTGHLGNAVYTMHIGNMVYDLAAGKNYADVSTTTELTMIGCTPDYKIGGAGVGNGKQIRLSTNTDRRGEATFSGNGSTKAFVVTHGMSITPTHAIITPTSTDALGTHYISAYSTTTFTVTYGIAPPTGTSNIKFNWRASVI
jgi:hypothetical protein